MVFCPEDGDPAMIKPRLYTDASVYDGRAGQGFLLEDGRITSARADDEDISLVQRLLESASLRSARGKVDLLLQHKSGWKFFGQGTKPPRSAGLCFTEQAEGDGGVSPQVGTGIDHPTVPFSSDQSVATLHLRHNMGFAHRAPMG